MLEGLRVASQNWIGRTIMGLVMAVIVISFAIWGIGDVFRGFSSQRLVKIGGGEVSVEAFRSTYQNELRRLQQRLRRGITNEEARRAGLDQQVLDRLITDVALDQRVHSLGLSVSDEEAQRLLKAEKAFRGSTANLIRSASSRSSETPASRSVRSSWIRKAPICARRSPTA